MSYFKFRFGIGKRCNELRILLIVNKTNDNNYNNEHVIWHYFLVKTNLYLKTNFYTLLTKRKHDKQDRIMSSTYLLLTLLWRICKNTFGDYDERDYQLIVSWLEGEAISADTYLKITIIGCNVIVLPVLFCIIVAYSILVFSHVWKCKNFAVWAITNSFFFRSILK